ncbi:hypothetical protein B296_00056746 [Ensete ventricosum]|uniref:Uncharacterized protein n=1 Tax=Ensete ventricosum TaxID=4639 RepID=A0A426XU04_ENSVE|nr:hypothetical protein B296_00056746 [Ensete ventricosum]
MVISLAPLLLPPNPRSSPPPPDPYLRSSPVPKKWRIGASSAAPGVDLKPLETAIAKDWGFFVPYLVGSISLVVLAVGSISPG